MHVQLFDSERLIVRALRESDFEKFHDLQSDEKVMRYTTGHSANEMENRQDLRNLIANYSKSNKNLLVWAVVLKNSKDFIGTCALVQEKLDTYEIGFRLLPIEWNKGYGQELVNALIKHAINKMNSRELVAYVDSRNTASIKILDQSNCNE